MKVFISSPTEKTERISDESEEKLEPVINIS